MGAVVEQAAELLDMKPERIVINSKKEQAVMGRSLVRFWSCSALGISQTELAQKFCISQPAVSAVVRRGEKWVI